MTDPYVCTEGPFLWGSAKDLYLGPVLFWGEFSLWSSPTWLGLALTMSSTPPLSALVGAIRPLRLRWGRFPKALSLHLSLWVKCCRALGFVSPEGICALGRGLWAADPSVAAAG